MSEYAPTDGLTPMADYGDGPRRTWQPVDLSNVLDGTWRQIEPTVGRRSDGVGMFYRGKSHTIASESEAGKTWLALSAAQDEIRAGNHVVYLDFEDDVGPLVGRLLALGVGVDPIREFFHYVRPEGPLGAVPNAVDLDDVLTRYRPTLGILDGVTEAMTLCGLNPLDNADAAKFGRMLPRRIADSGAAAVSLDHVTKSTETRGRYSIGAVHKLNGLDGAAYVLENRKAFGVGLTGRSTVKIAKDRPGRLRMHALPSSGMHWFGDLVMTSHADEFSEIELAAPNPDRGSSADVRPTFLMAKVAKALNDHGQLSQRQILTLVGGKREYAIRALTFLQIEGYVTDKTPHTMLKPFDAEAESR